MLEKLTLVIYKFNDNRNVFTYMPIRHIPLTTSITYAYIVHKYI